MFPRGILRLRAHTSFLTCFLNLVVTRSVFSKCPGQFITRCARVKLVRACTQLYAVCGVGEREWPVRVWTSRWIRYGSRNGASQVL